MEQFPDHVEGFVRIATHRFPEEADDYHHYFQIVCTCGGERFRVHLSNKKTLRVECLNCGRSVTVYDLSRYPAASKIPGEEQFHEVSFPETQFGRVYVMYEYGERDEDESPDRNDITWCQVWIENDQGKRWMILDDETA